jgi:hypothetical protein
MKKSRYVWSLVFNIIILLAVVWACGNPVFGFYGIAKGDVLATFFANVKLYGYSASLFAGIVAIIYIISDIVCLAKKKATVKWINVLKLTSVASLGVAAAFYFIVAPFILGKSLSYDWMAQLDWHSTLFLSIVIPAISLISYVFTELEPKVRLPHCLWCVLPGGVYVGVMAIVGHFVEGFLPVISSGSIDAYAMFRFNGSHHWYYYAIFMAGIVLAAALYGFVVLVIRNGIRKHVIKETAIKEETPIQRQDEVTSNQKPTEQPKAVDTSAAPVKSEPASTSPSTTNKPSTNNPVSSTPVQNKAVAPKKGGKKVLIVKSRRYSNDGVTITEDYSGNEEREEAQEEQDEAAAKANPATARMVQRVYHISKQPTGKWQVKLATGERAIKLFDTQEQAIAYAKALVKTQGGSIRVHSLTGKMRKQ